MCSLKLDKDGRVIQCDAHGELTQIIKSLSGSADQLNVRVVDLERSIKMIRNVAILLVGVLLGTGALQIKEILTLLGN